MTKLTYVVGNKEVISYQEAVGLGKVLGISPQPKYTKLKDEYLLNPISDKRRN
jgi:plasmid maintenance system antidote protein VapI